MSTNKRQKTILLVQSSIKSQKSMKDALQKLFKNTVFSAYDEEWCNLTLEKLCDEVAIIKSGKIVKIGKMKNIKGDKSLEKVFLESEA